VIARRAIEKAGRRQPFNNACSSVAMNGPRMCTVKRFTALPKEMTKLSPAAIDRKSTGVPTLASAGKERGSN
jgi:hypothetical protein